MLELLFGKMKKLVLFQLLLMCLVYPSSSMNGDAICQVCSCNGSIVSCASQGLKEFYLDISDDWNWIQKLDLSGNLLTEIPHLALLINLTELNLENNQIDCLGNGSFTELHGLLELNVAGNLITFKEGSTHGQTLIGLNSIKMIRMKQQVAPDQTADYCFLTATSTTLQHLYLTGIPELSPCFSELKMLKTLSLGGHYCNISSLESNGYSMLKKIPLHRLSLRNCGISKITSEYLQQFQTLKKLDLSCNPVSPYIDEINRGIQSLRLRTLIMDFINRNGTNCDWVSPMEISSDSLEIWSAQANHLKDFSQVSLSLPRLKYLNVGQNSFSGSAFNFGRCERGSFWCDMRRKMFIRLRFLGIDALTNPSGCAAYIPVLFDCNTESELFEDDEFEWNDVSFPDYLSIQLLHSFLKDLRSNLNDLYTLMPEYSAHGDLNPALLPSSSLWRPVLEGVYESYPGPNPETFLSGLLLAYLGALPDRRQAEVALVERILQKNYTTLWTTVLKNIKTFRNISDDFMLDSAIEWTVSEATEPEFRSIVMQNIVERRGMLPVNLTTVQARKNHYPSISCNDVRFANTNLEKLDFSDSDIGFILCNNLTGFEYLKKFICVNCALTGVNQTFLINFVNLTTIDVTGNGLGKWLRTGEHIFKGLTSLTELKLGAQKDGVKWLEHQSILTDVPNTEHIDISANQIEIWNSSLSANTCLRHLNLSHNRIKFLNEAVRDDFDAAHETSHLVIDLRGNPLGCECVVHERSDSMKWLKDRTYVITDLDSKLCDDDSSPLQPNRCPVPTNSIVPILKISLVISGTMVLIVMIAVGAVIYRKTLRSQQEYSSLQEDKLLFVSYPINIGDSQISCLRIELSKRRIMLISTNFNSLQELSSQYGSFGVTASQNLSEMISRCCGSILILNNEYFSDATTRTEFRLIESSGLLTAGKAIIVLQTTDIAGLPSPIQRLVDSGKFIVWPDCPDICTFPNHFDTFVSDIVAML